MQLPPMPDLGPIRFIPNESEPEAPLVNVAGIVRMARGAGTPEGERVYRAFVAAWDRMKEGSGSDTDKQMAALKESFAAIGIRVVTGVH